MSQRSEAYEKVIFNIHPKLKMKMKIAATRKRTTMTDFITSLIEEKLTPSKN